ncbi:hypothetical protein [Streptomyces somaliensis]|uniref:Uncharacterized protein n=1 Tax=Streptomyces somaliensis (strain ATCC 33201 / DSM 40738 / JCM 12659 / KCTC 9044 / NCTC 11332 / NRRL B-12077 / IP 733) TaxID=1134445 RepID=A0AA44DE33_STRE0|nr:hypothetical protein [Streptomyces somaliensis]NKY14715.1 hypothetical protein [Streptomyces somaliensis DSM 40738]
MSEASTDTTQATRAHGEAGGSGKHRGGPAPSEDASVRPHGRHRREPGEGGVA